MYDASTAGVTIGVPFYNSARTLADAIRSVFAQTHQNWELLLVDDGSTDESLDIARAVVDPRVRVISDGVNKGLAARLNEIAQLSRFDFIARMDSDDLMSPRRLETQLAFLLENTSTDLVSAEVVMMTEEGYPTELRRFRDGKAISPGDILAGRSGIVHGAVMGRRDWFLRNKYDERFRLAEDANLWVRAFSRGDLRLEIIPEPLYFYREVDRVEYRKLINAYRLNRLTIAEQWRFFGGLEASRAFTSLVLRSAAAHILRCVGQLDRKRKFRRRQTLSAHEALAFERQIRRIVDTPLPGKLMKKTSV